MKASVSGKTVFITGGGSWIGREIARQFGEQGDNVFITGRNEEKLKLVCNEIKLAGGVSSYRKTNVMIESELIAAIEEANKLFGRIDVIIPNAAVYPNTELTNIGLEEWNEVLATNLTGAFLAVKSAAPFLKSQKKGRIIFISSVAGDPIGVKGYGHYCASKAGLNGLMRSAALELANDNITVNCVSPGNICNVDRFSIPDEEVKNMINKIPMGRVGQPEDIANIVLYLASDKADFITGQTFIVDGGECIKAG